MKRMEVRTKRKKEYNEIKGKKTDKMVKIHQSIGIECTLKWMGNLLQNPFRLSKQIKGNSTTETRKKRSATQFPKYAMNAGSFRQKATKKAEQRKNSTIVIYFDCVTYCFDYK